MQNKQTKGRFTGRKNTIDFEFSLVAYSDEKLQVVYCPALDLFGYGKTEREAEKSFSIVTIGESVILTPVRIILRLCSREDVTNFFVGGQAYPATIVRTVAVVQHSSERGGHICY